MRTSFYQNSSHFLPRAMLLVCAALFCHVESGSAQAIAETASATAVSAGTTASVAKSLNFPSVDSKAAPGTSPHLQASSGPPPQVVNRRELEAHAGKDPGKLLLRSTPAGSQVWIDDKFVGNTPMLLVLAPGKYRVAFRGQRMEVGQQTVDLLPKETREVALTLATHYPTKVTYQ